MATSSNSAVYRVIKNIQRFCLQSKQLNEVFFLGSPSREPNTSAPVDENAEFNCVFRTKLEGLTLLYAAEMDGIISEEPVSL